MILFKSFLIEKIKAGIKTETRRLGKKRWSIGKVYWVCHKLYQNEPDCRIKVTDVRQEHLYDILPEDVVREGFEDAGVAGFIKGFKEINAGKTAEDNPLVWVVRFELVK
jgi:hypothetical protein